MRNPTLLPVARERPHSGGVDGRKVNQRRCHRRRHVENSLRLCIRPGALSTSDRKLLAVAHRTARLLDVRYSTLVALADSPDWSKKTYNSAISVPRRAFKFGYRDYPGQHNPTLSLASARQWRVSPLFRAKLVRLLQTTTTWEPHRSGMFHLPHPDQSVASRCVPAHSLQAALQSLAIGCAL